MTIKPLNKQVQVEIELKEIVSLNELTLESTTQTIISEVATVLAVGDKVSGINHGDRILFKGYALNEVHIDTENKIYLLDEENILAITE